MEYDVKPETPRMQSLASRVNRMKEEGYSDDFLPKLIVEVERIQMVKVTDPHA